MACLHFHHPELQSLTEHGSTSNRRDNELPLRMQLQKGKGKRRIWSFLVCTLESVRFSAGDLMVHDKTYSANRCSSVSPSVTAVRVALSFVLPMPLFARISIPLFRSM